MENTILCWGVYLNDVPSIFIQIVDAITYNKNWNVEQQPWVQPTSKFYFGTWERHQKKVKKIDMFRITSVSKKTSIFIAWLPQLFMAWTDAESADAQHIMYG